MAVYADPTRCPDCRSTLPHAPTTCPACALPLTGEHVEELFATLQRADALLATVRSGATPAAPAEAPRLPGPQAAHPVTRREREPQRRGLSAPSVPVILLGLGALCLLVAAVTFLVFAWSWLGVGGRTAVLVALTVSAGGLAEVLRRRDLRIAAESLGVIAVGLLVLDVLGADSAGWLRGSPLGLLALLGLAVAAPALAWTWLVHHSGVRPLVATQLAGVLGLSALTLGSGGDADELVAATAAGAALFIVLTFVARRTGLDVLAALSAVTACLWWLPLTLVGLTRAVDEPTLTAQLGDLRAWPLLAAVAVLVLATLMIRTSSLGVVAGFGTAATLVLLLALVIAADNHGPALAWVLVAGVLGSSVALVRLPSWLGHAAVVPLATAGVGALALTGVLLVEAAAAIGDLVSATWLQPWSVAVPDVADLDPTDTSAYLLGPVIAALVIAALAGRLAFRGLSPSFPAAAVPAGAGLVLAGSVTVASYGQPLVVVLGSAAAAGLVMVGWGVRRAERSGVIDAACGAAVLVVTVWASLASVGLTTAFATLATVAAAAVALRTAREDLRTLGSLVAPALGGLAVWTAGDLVGLPEVWRAAPVVLLLGLLVIGLPRLEIELAAIPTAGAAALASTWASFSWATPLAAYLTLGGALLVASALVNADRRWLAWAGGLLLAAATWVRLADTGVTTPEAYTMPTALALLAVGMVRLRRDRDADTWSSVSAGLLLATVPSLAVVLTEDPISLRALLLGAGCLVLVVGGAGLRWSAPLLVGAGVGAVLVLRECGPYAVHVPSWVVIGIAGSLLLGVGITWEARLLELRRGAAYVARLR